jgi:lipopolysaccharide/colanic/teichoic acid biosynthesis glycosyltransferase
MFFARVFLSLQKLAGLSPDEVWGGLHPPDRLRLILRRERLRAHRTGDPLSLVTFASRCAAADQSTPVLLAKILPERLRSTDEVGWIDQRRIGAVLPATTAIGAWKVADDVCLEFPEEVPPPICTVYSHPLDWPRGGLERGKAPSAGPNSVDRHTQALELLFVQALPFWKRAVDVAGAGIGLVLLLPGLAVIAGVMKVSSRGPVLFRQWRSGHGGKPFVMYKFRTMAPDAESQKAELWAKNERDGPAFKIKDDPRVTRLGRFLRSTSLDELPQLWNVFRGEMSLVGPRPLPCEESEACADWQRRRLDATPGLTCIWQVRGRQGVSFADWVRMDLEYIRSRSLWQDLKLLLLTAPAVILRKGAH